MLLITNRKARIRKEKLKNHMEFLEQVLINGFELYVGIESCCEEKNNSLIFINQQREGTYIYLYTSVKANKRNKVIV